VQRALNESVLLHVRRISQGHLTKGHLPLTLPLHLAPAPPPPHHRRCVTQVADRAVLHSGPAPAKMSSAAAAAPVRAKKGEVTRCIERRADLHHSDSTRNTLKRIGGAVVNPAHKVVTASISCLAIAAMVVVLFVEGVEEKSGVNEQVQQSGQRQG